MESSPTASLSGAGVRILAAMVHALTGPGSCCRFTPSCSKYAAAALQEWGWAKGFYLLSKRLGRCRPGGGSGFDPVPPRS